jgi:hypothetical protein
MSFQFRLSLLILSASVSLHAQDRHDFVSATHGYEAIRVLDQVDKPGAIEFLPDGRAMVLQSTSEDLCRRRRLAIHKQGHRHVVGRTSA